METVRDALLWEPLAENAVRCRLCSHRCRIQAGARGLCGVRENVAGTLKTLVFGRLVSRGVDPVEKKPLFHVAPGTLSYSIATAGCNLRCDHCQNYSISQLEGDRPALPGQFVPAADVVQAALDGQCRSVAYTYTEPTIFFEYALACMQLAREAGLLNVFVTNGFMTAECLGEAGPYLDAANVDLKAMDEGFYRKLCGARLAPVLENIRQLVEMGVWVEVTTLLIPGHNDDPSQLREIAAFLAGLGRHIPWHVTGFYPTYRLTDVPPTPAASLTRAREIGLEEGLSHIYAGNRPGSGGEDTLCPGCGATAIGRSGYRLTRRAITAAGTCSACGYPLAGIEMGGRP